MVKNIRSQIDEELMVAFFCGSMLGELLGTPNKDVVMVHYGDLELWLDEAH